MSDRIMPTRGRALEFRSLKQEILIQVTPIFITLKTTTFIARLISSRAWSKFSRCENFFESFGSAVRRKNRFRWKNFCDLR